ncbi:MAG: T9SS type A sorting domain-containing protein [Bacteroidetes bacterium]|nr:T9SS type A sorting domain-containing protein [Bacteroidota bacterium]
MKKTSTLLIAILSPALLYSQTPTFQGLNFNTAGTQGNEIISVAKDNSGNTYFCGSHTDAITLGTQTVPAGAGGAYWGKADATGNVLWLKQGGTSMPNNDKAYAISVDQNNNVYVCGAIPAFQPASFGGITLPSGNGGFVVKYSSSGNFIWVSGISSSVYSIAIDNSGTPIINQNDQTLYKLDPATGIVDFSISGSISGNLMNPQWHNIVCDAGNNIIAQAGNKIIKFDSNFNQLWSTPVTASLAETFRISADANGDVYGSFYALFGTVTIGGVSKSNFPNGYIYKLNAATGSPQFVDSILIAGAASKIKEIIVNNGNYYISGDGAFNTAHVLKMTPSYSTLWDKTLSSNAPVNDVLLLSEDCLFLGGRHNATIVLDSYTMTLPNGSSGIDNSYFSSLCAGTVGINNNATSNYDLIISPNPAQSKLTIKSINQIQSALVIDALGKIIPVSVIENKIDVSALQSGIYILKIEDGNGFHQTKFIKQ